MPPIPEAVQSGKPIQILFPTGDHSFELNHEALQSILLNERVRDKKVCVVSVAGAFRKGKSFLLDFLLRYLTNQGSADWLGRKDQPLKGFSWRAGSQRETTGIWIWSKVFLCPRPNGKEVAVILMDTQGVFDTESTVHESTTVFALSTMVSSVQVYNLSQNIQENDLQHLQFFIEYGRLATGKKGRQDKPFQSLMFLIRDWQYDMEHAFGESGGTQFLDKTLYKSGGHKELLNVRRGITNCFKKLGCFLMPYPGERVASNPNFDGRLSDINKSFKTYLKELAPLLLSKENLIVKKINGTEITCEALLEFLKVYIVMFKGDKLPGAMTVFEATANANNSTAIASARDIYTNGMDQICGVDKPFLRPDVFEEKHYEMVNKAIDLFDRLIMGDKEHIKPHKDRLLTEIQDHYKRYFEPYAYAINLAAVSGAVRVYTNGMDRAFANIVTYFQSDDLEEKHVQMRTDAIDHFLERKMGDSEHIKIHMDNLVTTIDSQYVSYIESNNCNKKKIVGTVIEATGSALIAASTQIGRRSTAAGVAMGATGAVLTAIGFALDHQNKPRKK